MRIGRGWVFNQREVIFLGVSSYLIRSLVKFDSRITTCVLYTDESHVLLKLLISSNSFSIKG